MAVVKPARGWTYDDLVRLPDDGKRYEIIDGELYEMPSPNTDHGRVVMNLIRLLLPAVTELGADLRTAPQDVFFPGADPVQPDVFLLMPDQLSFVTERGIEGPPALVIEVLSPSNPEHDRITKRALSERAAVREYWWVSPEAGTVEVLTLEGDRYRVHVRAGDDDLVSSLVLTRLSFPAPAAFSGQAPSQGAK